jgi:hypothetical protein
MVSPDEDLGRVVEAWTGTLLPGMDNITVLTESAFCVSALDKADLSKALERLAKGTPVLQVLGRRAKVVPLAALQAVRVSNKEAKLYLGYLDGDRRAQHTVQYGQPEQRKVFAALADQLGPLWQQKVTPSPVWSALALPVGLCGLVLFFAFLGFMAATQQQGGFESKTARGRAGGAIAGLIGPLGWAVIGCLALAVGVVWSIYAVLTRPPEAVELTRAEGEGE